jgi:hypothetical protein
MATIVNNTVYLVLYNYNDKNYSIIKTTSSVEKAYQYICLQEQGQYENDDKDYTMLKVTQQTDIYSYCQPNKIAVCYIISGKYLSIDLEHENISQYIIVPMTIE